MRDFDTFNRVPSLNKTDDLILKKRNEVVASITGIDALKDFGILYVNSSNQCEPLKEAPFMPLGDKKVKYWVVIDEIAKENRDSPSESKIMRLINSRGMSCIGLGLAIVGGALAAPASGGATLVFALAVVGTGATAAQCGLDIGQQINQEWDEFDGGNREQSYNQSAMTEYVEPALTAVSAASVISTGMKAGSSLASGYNSYKTGQMGFESGILIAAVKKNPRAVLKHLTPAPETILTRVSAILSDAITSGQGAKLANKTFDVYFVTTDK